MSARHITTWIKWPMVATVLAAVFIAYGLDLSSRAHKLQLRIAQHVALLEELGQLSEGLNHLGLVHRVDLHSGQYQWSTELERLRITANTIQKRFGNAPGMAELPDQLALHLHRTDSLHREAMVSSNTISSQQAFDAMFQLMLQRTQKVVDRTARSVHEQGIGAEAEQLSAHWNEARILLVTACLLAVVLAWLAGVSNRLLRDSRTRSMQLVQAKRKLEESHRELRETMLSKEEKEVMIKEIHHRVKNNLQIVKSLIRFQMDQVQDERTVELFNECVNRVSAMALVHEQTYLSKDLANIDVNSYLTHLTRDLCHAYTVDTQLTLDIRIELETLGVDTLIPLGLLINEVISNSLKYAFKGRSHGTIMVHLSGNQHGLYLRIGDDGVGIPDRERWERPQSLGMELIHTLAGQLDARIELGPGPGAVYELSSMEQERRKRA